MGWPGRAQRLICRTEAGRREARLKELIGFDQRGAIILQQKVSRLERRLANIPRCLIGSTEACSGSHHVGRQLAAVGHDVRLIPAQYVKPFLNGHKNDYRDAEAIAEAVQRPTMHFVAIKTQSYAGDWVTRSIRRRGEPVFR